MAKRWVWWLAGAPVVIVALGAAALGGWHVMDGAPAVPAPSATATAFDSGRLLVLADADMTATAYANGQLFPIAGQQDALIVLDRPGSAAPERTDIPASNTVLGWPGSVVVGPGGRFAYIVESKSPIGRDVERVGSVFTDLPDGRRLITVDLQSLAVVDERPVCLGPKSVDIDPAGRWLVIPCNNDAGELAVVALTDGMPADIRVFDLDLPVLAERPRDAGLTYAMVHPGGAAAGVIAANRGVALVAFDLDADGIPTAATAEAPDVQDGWLTVARWTESGDHFLVADVAWGPAPLDAVFNGDGAILSFALSPEDDRRGVVSTATVSKSPEAMELNREGDLLAVVNMERTYLPGGPLTLIPAREASSLSLVAVHTETGRLTTIGDPVGFRGVLPEDAVFDADGDQIAVVIYQDHDDLLSDGWVEFFTVDPTAADRPFTSTGRRIALPRGTHDLFVID